METTQTKEEPGKKLFIENEVYTMMEARAKEQNMTVDEYANQLLEKAREQQEHDEEPAEPIQTVNRTVTIKIAREFDDFLQILTRANGTTPEKYLAEELYGILCSFYEGGYWDHYLEPLGKRLDKLANRVWQEC